MDIRFSAFETGKYLTQVTTVGFTQAESVKFRMRCVAATIVSIAAFVGNGVAWVTMLGIHWATKDVSWQTEAKKYDDASDNNFSNIQAYGYAIYDPKEGLSMLTDAKASNLGTRFWRFLGQ